jgi:hypothetical protein
MRASIFDRLLPLRSFSSGLRHAIGAKSVCRGPDKAEVYAVLAFLNWFVLAIPFLVTVGATVLALKLPHERHYWKFVFGAIAVGLLFSGIAYWQQVLAGRQATRDRDTAITATADRVAKETTKKVTDAVGQQYQGLVKSLTDQIGDLKGQLAAQGKKVDVIGSSDIVTGKKPVKVEVTNGGIGASGPAPEPIEHLTLIRESVNSTNDKAPYAMKFTIQATIPINPMLLNIWFEN